jgi:hypothetical protein
VLWKLAVAIDDAGPAWLIRERLRGDHVYLGLPAKDPQPREIVGLPKDTVKKIVHTEFSNCSGSAASRQSGMRERTASIARRTR